MKGHPFAGLLAGFVIWSAAFLLLYGVQATGCKLGWHETPLGPTSLLRGTLSGMVLTTFALFYLMERHWLKPATGAPEDERRRLLQISRLANFTAAAATLVTFAGIFWLTLC
ncbi:hypothetical protein [Rhizobium glycinendophyticum]|uniref:Uncharacterized protein n=1 Tax=Rhizobium glycinendophyticum TaxID=2589807 RepID=A0A504TSR5_9HYPH|nr:hypothetical protein [Rhizobium glycinendophyticum]TPP05454.1 hypothetical protein FJQ55_20805 [Rhizobium glycinendophyticum]